MVMTPADPAAIHAARDALRRTLAIGLREELERLLDEMADKGPFSPDAAQAGRRALRNAALDALAAEPAAAIADRAAAHYASAANMTDAMGGLSALMQLGGEPWDKALMDFFERWKDEPQVLDKWFAIQARSSEEGALGRVLALTAHPAFDAKNPNRLRALVQTFSQANPARFHEPDGSGYRFLADQILAVDGFNPMTAARLLEPLGQWRRYTPELGELMRDQLKRIKRKKILSKNVLELATKALET